MAVIGLDIGGANIKIAEDSGRALSQAFDLWRTPQRLPEMLSLLLQQFSPPRLLAVTMTGELADCFATKAEGVGCILDAVAEVAGAIPVKVWQTTSTFASIEQARAEPLNTAAANWLAQAAWACRLVDAEPALLLDIGSTTTDIVPLHQNRPIPRGLTDPQRLRSGELVYSGVRRTPVCALAPTVPIQSQWSPLAAELFATSLDVYLLLGDIAESADDCSTANGGPATRSAAHDRLARMLCADRTEVSAADAMQMAEHLSRVQKQVLRNAVSQVLQRFESPCGSVIVAGSGEFLARRIAQEHPALQTARLISVGDTLSPAVAESACAHAVAVLARESAG